ncbi:MAG: FkbM family methyltransferase [Elusimicrobiota bacterium]|nr:FkbM family methyltransferase [Elusimicrobiota bacterium]
MTSPDQRAALLKELDRLVALRRMPRLERLLRHPFATAWNSAASRALNALFALGKSSRKKAETFFGSDMTVIVPSGYGEVYLYGATVDADAEVRLNKFLLRELKEGMTFFDIGACLGYYSLLAAALVGPKGAVHTFEPNPTLISILRGNLAGKSNVHVVHKAVSGTSGAVEFYVAPLPFIGTSSIRAGWQPRKTERVSAEATSLDDYCRACGAHPDIIKLDVEGVEDEVLKGAASLLRERAPVLVLEVFAPPIESDRNSLALLRELGYEPFAIRDDGSLQSLEYAGVEAHLAGLRERYRTIQDSSNDFDNMVFKRKATGEGASRLLS